MKIKLLVSLSLAVSSFFALAGCGNNTPTELQITKQPVTQQIRYEDGFDFSVEVNNPDLVKSYEWQAGTYNVSGEPTGFKKLDGYMASTNRYAVSGVTDASSRIPFRCKITDKNDNVIYTDVAEFIVTNHYEFVPCGFLVDYAVRAGETLDIATTPYGTGKISLNDTGDTYTFENINFSNQFYDTMYNGVAFTIETWSNTISNYKFILKGDNVFTNYYWEDDHNQGGASLLLDFLGQNSIVPTITFEGDGTLTTYGGTFGIKGYCDLVINADMNFYGLPRRLTKGIVVNRVTLKENKTINAVIGGHLIFTESLSDPSKLPNYNVTLENGSYINATICPGYVANGATSCRVISCVSNMFITSANVDIKVLIDAKFAADNNKGTNPLCCLNSDYGRITVTDSNINMKVETYNEDDLEGIAGARVCGVKAASFWMSNSSMNISLCSNLFDEVVGIESGDIKVTDSSLNVVCSSSRSVAGLRSIFQNVVGKVIIADSFVTIDIASIENQRNNFLDVGIMGSDFDFDFPNKGYISIKTNKAATLALCFATSEAKELPEEGYVAQHLILDDYQVTGDPYVINKGSYKGKENYVVFETLYTPDTSYQAYCKNIKLQSK